jgi:putative transposase
MARFVQAYDHEHHHTGIGLHSPADVRYGHVSAIPTTRSEALSAARAAHPERFTTNHDPKILAIPQDAWINQPEADKAA